LLLRAGQKSRHIFKGDKWDIEAVAEADETCGLYGSIDIEHACKHCGLICHNSDRVAVETSKSDDDIFGEMLCHLEEESLIDYQVYHLADIVGEIWIGRNNRVQLLLGP